MSAHLAAFTRAAARLRDTLEAHAIETRVGRWLDSDVLKLFKQHWLVDAVPGGGVFFSVWIDADALRHGRVNYNIHALKLRDLPGHKIRSRDFASSFRIAFTSSPAAACWPNLSLDHGPQTLLEGWIPLRPDSLESDVVALAERLVSLAPLIDALLAERATPPRPA
jgi:hypothetical protein